MIRFALLLSLALLGQISFAQAPDQFAGLPTGVNQAGLKALGFSCTDAQTAEHKEGVVCQDAGFSAELFGVRFQQRQVFLTGGQAASIRLFSAPYSDGGSLQATLEQNLRARYPASSAPRVLAGQDNSRRRFWYVAPGYTLVSGIPATGRAGGYVVGLSLLLPAAH